MTVLVTGAGGFIGSHLAEQLVKAKAHVRVLLRSGIQFDRFTEIGCQPIRGDITLLETLAPALESCEIVFHCAVGGGELKESRHVNVDGTINLLKAAAENGIKRIVHISSIAVHGTLLPKLVHEDQQYVTMGSPYELSKTEAERAILELGRSNNIEVVVVRPTLVYGPGSRTWTIKLLHRIKYGQIVLIGGGKGIANVVYIDDVTQAIMRAASVPGIAGEAFFVSGKETPTWREFLGRYCEMLGRQLPPSMSIRKARMVFKYDLWMYRLNRKVMRIDEFDLQAHVQSTIFSLEKANRVLGFWPAFDLNCGMAATRKWLKQLGYLPGALSKELR